MTDHIETATPAQATSDLVKNPAMKEVQPNVVTEGGRTDGKLVELQPTGNRSTNVPPVTDAIVTGDLGTQVTRGTSRPRGT